MFCVFDTAIGICGIGWDDAVTSFRLPGPGMVAAGTPPPPWVEAVIARVCRHLRGELEDFRDVAVDLGGVGPFALEVYGAAREIPPGQTTTYGAMARRLGRPGAARAVGQALGRNPIPLIIPCHRILAAGGKSGGFSAPGGVATKSRLLAIEGA